MVSTTDEVVNEVAVEAAAQPTEVPISDEDFEKAQKTFQLGKKNLFLNKYDESVNNIGDACKIYTNKYGEFGPQCAEIYFFYGKALLELARVENTVLGNALNGVPEDTGPIDDSRYGNPEDVAAEEKKEISDKVIDAMCESEATEKPATEEKPAANGEAAATNGDAVATNGEVTKNAVEPVVEETSAKEPVAVEKAETAEPAEVKADEAAAAATEEKVEEEEDDEENEEDDEEDLTKNDEAAKDEAEADDISNLQRSWEMFELAKLVYSKHFEADAAFKNKRIAECLLKLGEISIEQEIYDQAISDITESIRLQEEQAADARDERMLAESFYQLGLAQQFNNQCPDANDAYQKSINILQIKIEKLRGRLAALGEPAADDEAAVAECTTLKDEITDLEALLPEMLAKLEEVNEQGQQAANLIKEAKECFLSAVATDEAAATTVNGNGEVKDITCMLKSKRKISPEDELATSKKTRLSDSGEKAADVEAPAVTENGNVEMANGAAETKEICEEKTKECIADCNGTAEPAAAVEPAFVPEIANAAADVPIAAE